MIKVLKGFYDLKEGVFRSVDEEFEATWVLQTTIHE